MSDNKKYLISLMITICLAFSGYLYTYQSQLKLTQRHGKLERVNSQLRNLYGPLYALTQVEKRNWETFRQVNKPVGSYWSNDNPPTKEEAVAWRIYISEIDMPRYLKMEKIILENADLIEGNDIPSILLDLSIHIAGYKEVLYRWKSNDFSQNTSYYNYPKDIRDYAEKNYKDLKNRQSQLLGE
jgi:hypothetical protein